jgi:hypothetical protein
MHDLNDKSPNQKYSTQYQFARKQFFISTLPSNSWNFSIKNLAESVSLLLLESFDSKWIYINLQD